MLRITVGREHFEHGKFSLGRATVPLGVLSALFLCTTSLILLWPPSGPVTAANMNYTVVVLAAGATIAGVWWLAWARTHFKGPVGHHVLLDEHTTPSINDCVGIRHHQ